MTSDSIAVLIAYSGIMAGELLADAVERQPGLDVAARATTAEEALAALQSVPLDVALISAKLGDDPQGGFLVLKEMRELRRRVRPVLLFDSPEPNLVVEAFRCEARGVFCLGQSGFKMLCKCVKQVHVGHIWASNQELGYLVEAFSKITPPRVMNTNGIRLLSKREEEVVRLLSAGLQNRAIAKELKLSEHTVKNYLFRIFDKLGVSTRVELALYAASGVSSPIIPSVQAKDCEPGVVPIRVNSGHQPGARRQIRSDA